MYEAHVTECEKSNKGGREAKPQELKKSYRVHPLGHGKLWKLIDLNTSYLNHLD